MAAWAAAAVPAGDVWHVAVQGLPGNGVCYAVRVSGKGGWDTGYRWDKSRLLLDPRAPLVAGRKAWGKRDDFEEFQADVGSVGWGGAGGVHRERTSRQMWVFVQTVGAVGWGQGLQGAEGGGGGGTVIH
jgi:hypothetical protein